jgi:molybdopterin biosynthesis enzyme MoaB
MRYEGLKKTPRAMLSRAVAGVRGKNPYNKSPWKSKGSKGEP